MCCPRTGSDKQSSDSQTEDGIFEKLKDVYYFYDFHEDMEQQQILDQFNVRFEAQWGKYDIDYSVAFLNEMPRSDQFRHLRREVYSLSMKCAEFLSAKGVEFEQISSNTDISSASGGMPVVAIRQRFIKSERSGVRKPFRQKLMSVSYKLTPKTGRDLHPRESWTLKNGKDQIKVSDAFFRQCFQLTLLCGRQEDCIKHGVLSIEKFNLQSIALIDAITQDQVQVGSLQQLNVEQMATVLMTLDFLLVADVFAIFLQKVLFPIMEMYNVRQSYRLLQMLSLSSQLAPYRRILREKLRAAVLKVLDEKDSFENIMTWNIWEQEA
ncbi:hypothetical protein MIR68_003124 [Amoeboaphelidium protococcarum]|nr:hypothetical protein MIR68_003124 [Amoeboaphelidium protococcarum]